MNFASASPRADPILIIKILACVRLVSYSQNGTRQCYQYLEPDCSVVADAMETKIVVNKNFNFRLYPSTAQTIALNYQLAEACRLYNAALQERRDAYRMAGISLNYYDQANQLKDIRAAGSLDLANAQCAQDVLR